MQGPSGAVRQDDFFFSQKKFLISAGVHVPKYLFDTTLLSRNAVGLVKTNDQFVILYHLTKNVLNAHCLRCDSRELAPAETFSTYSD